MPWIRRQRAHLRRPLQEAQALTFPRSWALARGQSRGGTPAVAGGHASTASRAIASAGTRALPLNWLLGLIASALVATPAAAQTQTSKADSAEAHRPPAVTDTTSVGVFGGAPITIDPLVVTGERVYGAAASRSIRELDTHLRPMDAAPDLLRLAPGLVIAQHAGGGKAEQIFMRGFDADHGTDVRVSVDGVPINLGSHAHGQGYADLHHVIPQLVRRVDVRKGPFDVRDGDFATAGAVDFMTTDSVARTVIIESGTFGSRRVTLLTPLGLRTTSHAYAALSHSADDGPFESPQRLRRTNAYAEWTAPIGRSHSLRSWASLHDARWNASGQIPQRAVRSGLIPRFGAIDPTEGGSTSRYEVAVDLRPSENDLGWSGSAFFVKYDLDLFSNFTFFLDDPSEGDGIVQRDDRWQLGGHGGHSGLGWWWGKEVHVSTGVEGQIDRADVLLGRQTERSLRGVVDAAEVRQFRSSARAEADIQLTDRARLRIGAPADGYRFEVTSANGGTSGLGGPGPVWKVTINPKVSLAVALSSRGEVFLGAGSGFHSNDARAAMESGGDLRALPRALSGEIGGRWTHRALTLARAFWWIDSQSELVFVGDAGGTEATGPARRWGVDVEARARVASRFWADADVNWSRGRLRDAAPEASRIPLAPTLTATGGLGLLDPTGISAGVRIRHVGSRPADEQGRIIAQASTVTEARVVLPMGPVRARLGVVNLFNVRWNEAQFATTSRLKLEAAPVSELHFTPGTPRALRLGVEYSF